MPDNATSPADRALWQPQLTIITSLLNSREQLDQSLQSIAADAAAASQVTIRIVDANSRDAPIEIVERYAARLHIVFRSAHDRGIYHAWNRGVAATTTPWLTFLGAGDTFRPGALAILLERLSAEPKVDVLTARACLIYPSGRREVWGKPYDAREFSRWFSIMHSGACYSRALFDRYGNFDERFRITGDYEHLIRIAPRVEFGFLDAVLTDFPLNGISANSMAPLKEAYRVRKMHRTVGAIENVRLFARAVIGLYAARWFK